MTDASSTHRQVFHADAIPWLSARTPLVGASVVTSLPDVSELPSLRFAGWRAWFVAAAGLVLRSLPPEGMAIFFQSDVQHSGLWVDKGALVGEAAQAAGAALLFHKIVCRKPAGTATMGRATYAHMLGYARGPLPPPRHPRVHVLPNGGFRPSPKSMGVLACHDACLEVTRGTSTRTIVDPFCGSGTVLAVANLLGLDSIGVDVSARMCRKARALVVTATDLHAL